MRMRALQVDFRVSRCSCAIIVRDTAAAIRKHSRRFVRFPQTADEWKAVADRFWDKWDYPYCIGAIGKQNKQDK